MKVSKEALFDNFYNYQGFGPAHDAQPVRPEAYQQYRGVLPDTLLEYWETYGWCGFGQGLLWLVDPAEYAGVLEAWLGDTPLWARDEYYVFARSAFGALLVWGRTSGPSVDIYPARGMIFPTDCTEKIKDRGPDRQLQLFFSALSKRRVDERDEDEQPMFERALRALGPLQPDEVYGFVPALALGGRQRVENLQKVKALEHIAMLREFSEPQVMADIVQVAKDAGLF